MNATKCLTCNKPVTEHATWSAADITESKAATFSSPVLLACGVKVFSPISPVCVGTYRGHDPIPPRN